ncbi:uncharacterized protein TNCV_2029521 [Trichonephila clavipes]|nr:uncharacterized protein TNCV_2029521 [Trichonephila clavipes]
MEVCAEVHHDACPYHNSPYWKTMSFHYVFGSKRVPRSLHIITRRESLLRLNQESSLNISHTPMLVFQTPVQTSVFKSRREGNANCWSSGIQARMIESPVNSFSRNSFSCGDCERRTQCSGNTVTLTSRTYNQTSVLARGCDSCVVNLIVVVG